MLIKKETEYAVFGLLALSKQKDTFYDVQLIAKREKISPQLLAKIFQKLARAKIVESKTGTGGGFRLKKEPQHIKLLDILEAVQKHNIIKCHSGKAVYCRKQHCPVKAITTELQKNISKFFSGISLSDIARKY